jgi:hypothetical protein
MAEEPLRLKKATPIIVITWILSLATTLAIVYVSPNILPPIQIRTENIRDGAIITAKLADGSVTSAKILDGTITAVDIRDGAIITAKVANGSITTEKISNGAITTIKLADGSVTSAKILDGTITAQDLADGCVVTMKLADGSVTSAKILDGTITAADLATGAVTEIKIADGAITTVKIADYAVTNKKLASNAIPFASAYSTLIDSTDSTLAWVDMDDMAVTITLVRTSHIIIMFSAEAYNSDPAHYILVQALVGTEVAAPGSIYLTPYVGYAGDHNHGGRTGETAWHSHTIYWDGGHRHTLGYAAYSFNFYKSFVSAGTYTIKIQWKVSGGIGYVRYRTLNVIALPA